VKGEASHPPLVDESKRAVRYALTQRLRSLTITQRYERIHALVSREIPTATLIEITVGTHLDADTPKYSATCGNHSTRHVDRNMLADTPEDALIELLANIVEGAQKRISDMNQALRDAERDLALAIQTDRADR